jgi:hypothetical protein
MFESFLDKMQSELFCEEFNLQGSKLKLLTESSDGIEKKLLDIEELPYYDIKKEIWKVFDSSTEMESAYNKNNKYIGPSKLAKNLVKNFGIKEFDVIDEDDNVCSIGFNPDKGIWYGWSHRAIVGFKIGDKIFEEKFGNDNTLFTKHGKNSIKTLDQAKESAKNFARYVS